MKRRLQLIAGTLAIATALLPATAQAASAPSVVTGGTSFVTDTRAVLHGTVNPNGAATTYHFEWGLTKSYGSKGAVKSAGSGTNAVSVTEAPDHLAPGTKYHYRLVATNSSGTTFGADRTFTTHPAPHVSTGTAIDLNASGATLTGTVNPAGQTTGWFFQWGSLSSLSQQTAPQMLGASNSPQAVGWSLQGLLNPGTVYQYRLVATHAGARTYGSTAIFMTYPSVRPYAQVRAITRPRHRLRYPYTFTTTGTIGGPSWIPAQFACLGEVTLRFYRDSRQVRFETAPVQSNCTYSATSVFYRLPGRGPAPARLTLFVHFVSTPYLANGRPAHDRVTIR